MESVIQHIQAPQKITGEDVANIDSLLHEFPYFQTAQLLLAKGLLNTDSIRYNQQLKKAAIYSLDRKQLFKLIRNIKQKKNLSQLKVKPNKVLNKI